MLERSQDQGLFQSFPEPIMTISIIREARERAYVVQCNYHLIISLATCNFSVTSSAADN